MRLRFGYNVRMESDRLGSLGLRGRRGWNLAGRRSLVRVRYLTGRRALAGEETDAACGYGFQGKDALWWFSQGRSPCVSH